MQKMFIDGEIMKHIPICEFRNVRNLFFIISPLTIDIAEVYKGIGVVMPLF